MEETLWRRAPGGGGTWVEESCRMHLGDNWEAFVSMYRDTMEGESWRRPHGEEIMEEESRRRYPP